MVGLSPAEGFLRRQRIQGRTTDSVVSGQAWNLREAYGLCFEVSPQTCGLGRHKEAVQALWRHRSCTRLLPEIPCLHPRCSPLTGQD